MTQPYDVPLPLTIDCPVCKRPMPFDNDEPCDDCMNQTGFEEKWYYDGSGDEPGWQDSHFPNEY